MHNICHFSFQAAKKHDYFECICPVFSKIQFLQAGWVCRKLIILSHLNLIFFLLTVEWFKNFASFKRLQMAQILLFQYHHQQVKPLKINVFERLHRFPWGLLSATLNPFYRLQCASGEMDGPWKFILYFSCNV